MNFKNTNASRSTITRNVDDLSEQAGNLYQMINVVAKRANQISVQMKEELTAKLEEFASSTDNLEEIFENREQIEISKFYERLPKPVAIAIQEYIDEKIYFRNTFEDNNSKSES